MRAVGVGVAAFLIFNLNLRAIGSRDTHVMEHVALSLATEGDADVDEFGELVRTGLAEGYLVERGGHIRSAYPVLPALIAAPAYFAAVKIGLVDPRDPASPRTEAVGKLVASALVALASVALVIGLTPLTSRGHASTIALTAALATPLWSSASQALWTHAAAACLLAFGLAALLGGRESLSPSRALLAGAALAAAAVCRPLLVGFPLAACLAVPRRQAAFVATGAAVVLVLAAGYNALAYGSPLGGQGDLESTAVHARVHGVAGAWSLNPLPGLAGILVSPSRGLLIFSPILMVCAWVARRAWRASPRIGRAVVLPACLYLAGWACYRVWWTGHAFGPRYAADLAVPAAFIAAAARLAARGTRPAERTLVAVTLAWSIAIQALGAFFHPNGQWNALPADVDRAHERLWDWRDNQIVRTLRAGPYTRHFNQLFR